LLPFPVTFFFLLYVDQLYDGLVNEHACMIQS
jgi:hypothetical protein